MAKDVKVQRGQSSIADNNFSVTIEAGTDYVAPSSASKAFIRIISSFHSSMADFNAGGDEQLDDETVRISYPTGDITDDVQFTRADDHQECKISWEIIEYIGGAGGDNEFIVRDVGEVAFANGVSSNDSGTIAGISSRSDCVPFITSGSASGGITYRSQHLFRATVVDSGGNDVVRLERGRDDGSTCHASYACVEFTGSNWTVQTVQHTYADEGNEETEAISSVGATSRAFIHAQFSGGGSGDNDFGHEVYFNSVTELGMRVHSEAASFTTVAQVYVVSNSDTGAGAMSVQHVSGTKTGGGSEPETWTESITAVSATEDTSLEINARADERYAAGTIPILAWLTNTTTITLGRVDTADPVHYRVQAIQWPVASGGSSTETLTLSLDAAIQSTVTKTLDLDAAVQDTFTLDVDLDSVIVNEHALTLDLDAAILSTIQKDLSLDAAILDVFTKTMDLDAVVVQEVMKTLDLDAALLRTYELNVDLDAALQETFTKTLDLDASLVYGREVDLDAVLMVERFRYLTLDAIVKAVYTKLISVDAAIQDTFTKTLDLDASLKNGRHVFLDAALYGPATATVDLDAVLVYGRHVELDAYIVSEEETVDADRHRFEGDKIEGGEYGSTTQTQITYPAGLEPS